MVHVMTFAKRVKLSLGNITQIIMKLPFQYTTEQTYGKELCDGYTSISFYTLSKCEGRELSQRKQQFSNMVLIHILG